MKHPIILGLQYGDEGKGKITDLLASQADYVIRFNGGANAGHSLWVHGKKVVTHSIPSGILYPHVVNYIGAGCVIDPVMLKQEFEELSLAGAKLTPQRLIFDFRAHLTFPIHKALDSARESSALGIGSTKRGIGPTYATKMDRVGLRAGDLLGSFSEVEKKLKALCEIYNPILREAGAGVSSFQENLEVLRNSLWMREFISQDPTFFYDISKTKKCLLEGAQGILLDLDHGFFPYVTSSNTLSAYAAIGTPFPFSRLGKSIGVAKVYVTRVGHGPMPSEIEGPFAEELRKKGREFGATTGRPRRVGWLNLDELRLAVRLTDCQTLVLTKGDILEGLSEVKLLVRGAYEVFPGWEKTEKNGVLDPNFEAYVSRIESFLEIPVVAVGTGADREAILWRHRVDCWKD